MNSPLPDGYVVHLPPPKSRSPHLFNAPVFVPSAKTLTHFPQTERACAVCKAVKVTVHGADGTAWREWRSAAGDQGPHEVACTVISAGGVP